MELKEDNEKLDDPKAWARWLGIEPTAALPQVAHALERRLPTLAAELQRWPLYVRTTSTMPEPFHRMARHRAGWFSSNGYFQIKPHLNSDDRGPGIVLFVNDHIHHADKLRAAQAAQQTYLDRGENVELSELLAIAGETNKAIETLCRIAVHEAAHSIVAVCYGEFECELELNEIVTRKIGAQFGDQLVERAVQAVESEDAPPLQLPQHGPTFTRIMCHLAHRLRLAGVPTKPAAAGPRYDQASILECQAALAREVEECVDWPFPAILAMPMPDLFAACIQPTSNPPREIRERVRCRS